MPASPASQFTFLRAEWPAVFEAAKQAESFAYADPRIACFYARRTLEIAVAWVFKHDTSLTLPYQDNLGALMGEPTFQNAAGAAVFAKARVIQQLGNQAVHSHRIIRQYDSQTVVRELFHVCYWLAHTYARGAKPPASLAFDIAALPQSAPAATASSAPAKTNLDQLKQLEEQLRAKDEKLCQVLADKNNLDAELTRIRAEIAEAKRVNAATPDAHDYTEAKTRDFFIDLLLKEAGWPLDKDRDRELKIEGMPNNEGVGYVDYVLWGDDGKPLGLVEAKRATRDAKVGQQQARLYADCLEKKFGQRPVIFYSNGYEHFIWDDCAYPPRPVQGFYKKDELELLIHRRATKKTLAKATLNNAIAGRSYQGQAIRSVGEAFEKHAQRKALLVMATGSGKTRTVIALCDLLMRCNHAKRILFLADRVALVNQAVGAFKKHLPDASPVNLVTDKETEGRVFVSTYPTMMGLMNDMSAGTRRFGPGHFDLVIIDEAHRSVFQKYRAIFDYFDSLLVGLTATPKDEIDRNTYGLFDITDGNPTFAYSLEQAVADGYLVPFRAVSATLKYPTDGIRYDDLTPEEQEEWDAKEWDDDGGTPAEVEADAVNTWLFNADTVDQVLKHIWAKALRVAGGDRLAKTIIFAKNNDHANFIVERFNTHFPHYKGAFARAMTYKTEYAQSLIDAFSKKDDDPHIAVSVDMLDTGIDVPEVANLVFFKPVRSKTKFWQMIGRGTRLCPGLFGPGADKKEFLIFDYCRNFEYFSQNPDAIDPSVPDSLGTRLFKARLELIGTLDKPHHAVSPAMQETAPSPEDELRFSVAETLHTEVASMRLENFVVRPKRRLVEKYAKADAWKTLTPDDLAELAHEVASLPSETPSEEEEAKRFDLLMLYLQLAVLRAEPGLERLRDQIKTIAGLLEEKSNIPMVKAQLPLLQELQTEDYWRDITAPMLETVRKNLRALIKLIDKKGRKIVYTDFKDEMGAETITPMPGIAPFDTFERFQEKARAFLRAHLDHIAIAKLRLNEPLTPQDIKELERIFAENGIGNPGYVEKARKDNEGLGLFVRSLVGMDREAAKRAMSSFLAGKTLTSNQMTFVDLIVNHLTEHGTMTAAALYEPPFTDIAPQGPDTVFAPSLIDELIGLFARIKARALG